jgi:hypothetical protein
MTEVYDDARRRVRSTRSVTQICMAFAAPVNKVSPSPSCERAGSTDERVVRERRSVFITEGPKMKNTAYAAAILGISVLLCGGSTGLAGCAASATPTDFGSDDSGTTHSDGSTHHDGATGSDSGGGAIDSGGGGLDSGGGGLDSGGGGGDSGGMNCGLMSANATCNACLDSMCCSQAQTCAADTDCTNLLTCIQACAMGDTACENTCAGQHPTGTNELNAVGDCLTNMCPTQCP